MRTTTAVFLGGGLLLAASFAAAQRPGGGGGGGAGADDLVTRMMAFDKDRDGTLTRSEVTDERLQRLFDRADADKNGSVTKAELTALAAQEPASPRRGGPGGPGGPMMGMPRPGEILPPMLQQRLNLSDKQKAQLADLQKDVDTRLETILDEGQNAQLKEMRQRRPGGFGPPGGRPPGGFAPPNGRPPAGDGPPGENAPPPPPPPRDRTS